MAESTVHISRLVQLTEGPRQQFPGMTLAGARCQEHPERCRRPRRVVLQSCTHLSTLLCLFLVLELAYGQDFGCQEPGPRRTRLPSTWLWLALQSMSRSRLTLHVGNTMHRSTSGPVIGGASSTISSQKIHRGQRSFERLSPRTEAEKWFGNIVLVVVDVRRFNSLSGISVLFVMCLSCAAVGWPPPVGILITITAGGVQPRSWTKGT